MKLVFANKARSIQKSRCAEQGSARTVLLALVSFLLGVAVTAFFFRHAPASNTAPAVSQTVSGTTSPPAAQEPIGLPPATPPPAPTPAKRQPIDAATVEQVKKAVPNFASISLDEGEQTLRIAALKQFADTSVETDDAIKRAQQQLQDAQNSGSEADQQAAMKHVQDTQAAAAEKLKRIAANLQEQIAALKSLKNSP